MTITTHIDAIRRDILESPDDDGLRLILADMLRDSHRPRDVAEGEFVALSMRYAALPYWECGGCLDLPMCGPCEAYDAIGECGCDGYCDHLRRPEDKPTYGGLLFWRGMPHTWAVADVPTFEREAKGVFGKHPIRRVVLRCQPSWTGTHEDHWPVHIAKEAADISRVYGLLSHPAVDGSRQYPSLVAFLADLEAACARYGRMVAGLPALSPTTTPE